MFQQDIHTQLLAYVNSVVISPPILAAGQPTAVPLAIAPAMVTEIIGSTAHAAQNQPIAIECVLANGTGLPRDTTEFYWYRMSIPLENDSRISIQFTSSGSILTIRNASREDSGQYRCLAQNPAGYDVALSDVFGKLFPFVIFCVFFWSLIFDVRICTCSLQCASD